MSRISRQPLPSEEKNYLQPHSLDQIFDGEDDGGGSLDSYYNGQAVELDRRFEQWRTLNDERTHYRKLLKDLCWSECSARIRSAHILSLLSRGVAILAVGYVFVGTIIRAHSVLNNLETSHMDDDEDTEVQLKRVLQSIESELEVTERDVNAQASIVDELLWREPSRVFNILFSHGIPVRCADGHYEVDVDEIKRDSGLL